MNAETLMLGAGIAAFVFTVYWVRNRDLREKYAAGWLCAATLLLLGGCFPEVLIQAARDLRVENSTLVLFLALMAIYAFAFASSLSLTRQHRRNLRLAQQVAILEKRVKDLEQELGKTDGPAAYDLPSSSSTGRRAIVPAGLLEKSDGA